MVRRLLWDGKVPGSRAAAGVLKDSQVHGSVPCQAGRIEQHQNGPGCLKCLGGNKDEVADAQGRCSPAETVDTGWVFTREIGEPGDTIRREKSWTMTDPNQESLRSGWKDGLCKRLGAYWEQQAWTGWFCSKKRLSVGDWGTLPWWLPPASATAASTILLPLMLSP